MCHKSGSMYSDACSIRDGDMCEGIGCGVLFRLYMDLFEYQVWARQQEAYGLYGQDFFLLCLCGFVFWDSVTVHFCGSGPGPNWAQVPRLGPRFRVRDHIQPRLGPN